MPLYWRTALLALVGAGVIIGLLFYRLASLTGLYSNDEITARAAASSAQKLRTNPLFAPHKGLQLVLQHFHHYGPMAMRSVSVLVGMIAIVCLYFVLLRWYTLRIAVIGTLLFTTSSWFLHTVRLATTDSMFLVLFIVFASGVWLQQSKSNRLAIIVAVAAGIGALYIPGMIWFLLPAGIWQRRRLLQAARRLSWWQLAIAILVSFGLLAPLALALVQQSHFYKTWLGLPATWPGFHQIGRNFINIPKQLLWHGPNDASRWLPSVSLLGWFGIVMFIVGTYAHWFKLHLDRTWLLIYIAIVGTLLIAMGGSVQLVLFMPFIYLVIASGIALMLQQWFTVFPRNPFARSLGLSLMIIAVLLSSRYQLTQYFVAWPHNPRTKTAFTEHP